MDGSQVGVKFEINKIIILKLVLKNIKLCVLMTLKAIKGSNLTTSNEAMMLSPTELTYRAYKHDTYLTVTVTYDCYQYII